MLALRTPHIDSNYLDESFHSYNWDMFSSLFRYSHSHLIHSFKHEWQLFVRLIISSNTLLLSSSTVGQTLLKVKYSLLPLNRREKCVHILLLFVSYVYEKYLVESRRLLPVQFIYKCMLVLNFLVFLRQGKYLTLFERVTRLTTVHTHAPTLRILDYSIVQRELIWHTLNETLGSFIPFLSSLKTRTWLRQYAHHSLMKPLQQTDQCAVCEQPIYMPHESVGECQHYFCYFCSYSLIEQSCPICFRTIQHIRPKDFFVQ
jgi:hypothetical protein